MNLKDLQIALETVNSKNENSYSYGGHSCLILYEDGSGHIQHGFASDQKPHIVSWNDVKEMETKIKKLSTRSVADQLRELADELERNES